mgnify:CR=1 FL=1
MLKKQYQARYVWKSSSLRLQIGELFLFYLRRWQVPCRIIVENLSATRSPRIADGLHVMAPGAQPSPEQLEEMTRMFQESIRNSPMWGEMIKEYGAEKAEELLKQCKANLK